MALVFCVALDATAHAMGGSGGDLKFVGRRDDAYSIMVEIAMLTLDANQGLLHWDLDWHIARPSYSLPHFSRSMSYTFNLRLVIDTTILSLWIQSWH